MTIKKDSDILIDQLHAIDNRRLTSSPILKISDDVTEEVEKAICEVLGVL